MPIFLWCEDDGHSFTETWPLERLEAVRSCYILLHFRYSWEHLYCWLQYFWFLHLLSYLHGSYDYTPSSYKCAAMLLQFNLISNGTISIVLQNSSAVLTVGLFLYVITIFTHYMQWIQKYYELKITVQKNDFWWVKINIMCPWPMILTRTSAIV